MSFVKYLKDNYRLLIFYCIQMLFIFSVIYLDRSNRMLKTNIIYIMVVSGIMFCVYLVVDYLTKNNHLKKLLNYIKSEDKSPILPKPIEYKDEAYSTVIVDLYNYYINSLREVEEQFKENSEFMTAWVHEIKTPITTSKLLIERREDESDLLFSIKEEINKIEDYVEKVLYHTRSDSFSKDYIITENDINSLVKESIKKHSIIFIRKNIKVINDINEKKSVESDKKWLMFIVDQIISNALKYTNRDGFIKFSFSENEKEKELVIEDNGIGIKKEDIQRIFTKSFTGSNGRDTNNKSTGLGLYLSQKLAKKLGHSITVESEYNKGTKVYIHFPKWNDYYL
jgi:Signal transduction histidine kinase